MDFSFKKVGIFEVIRGENLLQGWQQWMSLTFEIETQLSDLLHCYGYASIQQKLLIAWKYKKINIRSMIIKFNPVKQVTTFTTGNIVLFDNNGMRNYIF